MNSDNKTNIAIVVASGLGSRFNSSVPKQFHCIDNNRIINIILKTLVDCSEIKKIVCVLSSMQYQEYCIKHNKIHFCLGGDTRQQSVHHGLEFINENIDLCDNVIIQDGCRPFTKQQTLQDIISNLNTYRAVAPALTPTSTLAYINNDHSINDYANREKMQYLQTPQGFKFKDLQRAHNLAKLNPKNYTDDTSIIHYNSEIKTHLIEGDPLNIKITNAQDIELANLIYKL